MRRILHASLLTSTVLAGIFAIAGPALAQMDQTYDTGETDSAISFDAFYNQLAPYGYWLYSDRWGLVWQPQNVADNFHPYLSDGHWIYTDDYGWFWQSDQPWGDIAFHFGRWVDDPDDGWLWIPGYIWSPGWVVWRSNGRYIGWMPMPPDEGFLEGRGDLGVGVSFHFGVGEIGAYYGYSRWYPDYSEAMFARNWVFVGAGEITAPSYRTVAIRNPQEVVKIIHNTRNITNYTVINNHVVNKSVNVKIVEQAAGHPVRAVRAATVIRNPRFVASVAVGQRVQLRMRAIAPHGRGVANSAPPPPERVVAKLSTHAPAARANGPSHLYTRATVKAPEAQGRFHGTPGRATGPGEGANGMSGPNGQRTPEAQPNGMAGPNGGAMGPNGERHRGTQPNGMTGPNETAGPNGERSHETQPNGMTGPGETTSPNGERHRGTQPNGMTGPNETTGPNGERSHETQPNGMTGPGETTSPSGERHRGTQPGGMTGPDSQPNGTGPNETTGPNGERHRGNQPGSMNGPGGQPNGAMGPDESSGPSGERQRSTPGSMAGPNQPSGPNGEPMRETRPNTTGPGGERHHGTESNSMSGPPGPMGPNGESPRQNQSRGTMGPNGGPPSRQAQPAGAMGGPGNQPAMRQQPSAQGQQETPPHHKKKEQEQNPPQNPPK